MKIADGNVWKHMGEEGRGKERWGERGSRRKSKASTDIVFVSRISELPELSMDYVSAPFIITEVGHQNWKGARAPPIFQN